MRAYWCSTQSQKPTPSPCGVVSGCNARDRNPSVLGIRHKIRHAQHWIVTSLMKPSSKGRAIYPGARTRIDPRRFWPLVCTRVWRTPKSEEQSSTMKRNASQPESSKEFGSAVASPADVPRTSIHKVEADGVRVFYRAAGEPKAPTVLLLHGFPASSCMFRELIARLPNDYRVIAPDLPGFGFTEVPAENENMRTPSMAWPRQSRHSPRGSTQSLCNLRVRLRRAHRVPAGDGSPGASHGDRFTEWKCIRRRIGRCLGADPEILGRTNCGESRGPQKQYSHAGRHAMAVHPRRKRS